MRKIVYSVAMSLDGFLAGPKGEFDWIAVDPEINFEAMMARFDTVVMGRLTYEAVSAHGGGDPVPGARTFVVSRTIRPQDHPGITVIDGDLAGMMSRMRNEPGKDIWLFGGGVLFRSLLGHGLVDMVEVAVLPILLGDGIPVLPTHSVRTALRLVSNRLYATTGTMMLEYAVEREPA